MLRFAAVAACAASSLQLALADIVEGSRAEESAVLADDECATATGGDCALAALQLRSRRAFAPEAEDVDEVDGTQLGEMLVADDLPPGWNATDSEPEAGEEALGASPGIAGGELHANGATNCAMTPFLRECLLYLSCMGRPYCVLAGYMVVPGKPVAGMESINSGNAASFDYLMSVAHSMCSDTGCVLITNPVHYRTQEQLHIHFRHYNGGGASVKRHLESYVCGKGGWMPYNIHSNGCGIGKVRVFDYFPGVFSQVAAAHGGGSLANVGISVWSTSECGGAGVKTIVLTTTHCSIEHSISER